MLKKLVVLYLCGLIKDNSQNNLSLLMIFGNGEAWQDALIMEFNEGACDNEVKRHLVEELRI